MGNDDGKILYLIEKLRRITLQVQVAPFLISAAYIVVLFLYQFVSEQTRYSLDTLFYVSPIVSVFLLTFSRTLKLCKWHRRACMLPMLPQIFVFIDYHIFEFTERMARLAMILPALMAILLLIAAYNVFIKPHNHGRKRRTNRDS
jgi:hypothetical protein